MFMNAVLMKRHRGKDGREEESVQRIGSAAMGEGEVWRRMDVT